MLSTNKSTNTKILYCVGVFLLFSASVEADLIEVTDCDNGMPRPERVVVKDCKVQPCIFIRGSDVLMNMTFMAKEELTILRPGVNAHALGVTVPFPLPVPDGCEVLINNRCPVELGEIVTYELRLPIVDQYPEIDFSITFRMHKDRLHLEPFLCFQLSARVVAP